MCLHRLCCVDGVAISFSSCSAAWFGTVSVVASLVSVCNINRSYSGKVSAAGDLSVALVTYRSVRPDCCALGTSSAPLLP